MVSFLARLRAALGTMAASTIDAAADGFLLENLLPQCSIVGRVVLGVVIRKPRRIRMTTAPACRRPD